MPIFREIPPTAGWPIQLNKLLLAIRTPNGKNSLKRDFINYLGLPYAEVTYSGTAGLYLLLESLKAISDKRTVIIPSYVCPLVPLAALKAGLKVVYCDIARDNFNYDYTLLEQICSENDDILTIIAIHLAGIPIDLSSVKRIAGRHRIFIIEDCAQSLGAKYLGEPVGSIGDFSFFSLCRGKGLTIYEGGVIAAKDNKNGLIIAKTIERLAKKDFFAEALKIFELFGYWIFYRPLLFWFVFKLPEAFWILLGKPLKAAAEEYDTDFQLCSISDFRAGFAHVNFPNLDRQTSRQIQIANHFIEELAEVAGIHIITQSAGSAATYPYLAIIFDDPLKQKKALTLINRHGLGASRIYLKAIDEYDFLKNRINGKTSANARYIAEHSITITTNTFLSRKDSQRIIEIIKNLG